MKTDVNYKLFKYIDNCIKTKTNLRFSRNENLDFLKLVKNVRSLGFDTKSIPQLSLQGVMFNRTVITIMVGKQCVLWCDSRSITIFYKNQLYYDIKIDIPSLDYCTSLAEIDVQMTLMGF